MTDIRIYQIDLDRDHDGVAFEPYASLSRWQDSPDVNASLYETVFKGEIEAKDIEDIYRIFNTEKPEGYEGRSLSVSDVVEIVKSDDIRPGFYYCDSIGFKVILRCGTGSRDVRKVHYCRDAGARKGCQDCCDRLLS